MPESTTAESTLQPPVLDNAEALPSPASTQEENDELIYISPVVSSLSIEARPDPSPACETCPLAMWHATKDELRCFCGRMHAIVWRAGDTPILKCDGRELALLQMQQREEQGGD